MANIKQSEFPSAGALIGSETVCIIQGGLNRKSLLSSIRTYVLQGMSSFSLTGLSTALDTAVTSADSILVGIGKLQGQSNYFASLLSNLSPVLILARSAVAVTAPLTTNEEVLATITVPAGLMKTEGQLKITTLWSYTNSTNIKTLRVRFGGIGGTAYLSNAAGATLTSQTLTLIRNRNSATSQVGYASGSTASFAGSTSPVVTSNVNTVLETTIVITGQKAVNSESIVLESYTIELIK